MIPTTPDISKKNYKFQEQFFARMKEKGNYIAYESSPFFIRYARVCCNKIPKFQRVIIYKASANVFHPSDNFGCLSSFS